MYIEFNISLNGKHFFATHKRSCTNSMDADTLNKVLQEKFPKSEGYKISATLHPERGFTLDLSNDISLEVNSVLTL
jgi:hypothetical protein